MKKVPRKAVTCTAKVWLWRSGTAPAAWHFITIPLEKADVLKKIFTNDGKKMSRGWGSIPVVAKVGKTEWRTSIFPAKDSGGYLLPVKLAVRTAEGLYMDGIVKVTLCVDSIKS
jgi:hypothetical protein